MRSLRLAGIIICLATVSLFTESALANSTVNMQLVGVGSNSAGGVYTYPYYFSINGGAPVALICDSYDNHVDIGETWQAHVVGLLSGKGLFGNSASAMLDYKAAGLIFKSVLNGTLSANVGNFAIWGLFSTNASNSSYFQSSGAGAVDQQYLSLALTAPSSAYKGLVLYAPISGSQSMNGTPQEYIGYAPVPEPGTITMFGTGLIALAVLLRRRQAAAN